jgi:hypothetical protein
MANPEESPASTPARESGASGERSPDAAANAAAVGTGANAGRETARAAMLFGASLLLCLLAYVALSVPGNWFPGATPRTWTARDLALTRGGGGLDGDALVVTAIDPSGLALVALSASFRSSEYPAIAWSVTGVSGESDVRLLWSSDYDASRVNSVPLAVESGRLLPVSLGTNPNWVGRITGIALAIRGPLPEPLRVSGVVAKPMGAVQIIGERIDEWLAFESRSGSSINTVTGGAEVQELPLPLLLVTALLLAVALWYVGARRRAGIAALPWVAGALFVIAWTVLDLRWTSNLLRQANVTAAAYAGKDWRERHLAAEDGPLFAFIEKVRAKLPASPARVIVVADADYFRGRGAYHLYPHNVYFDPRQNTMPAPSSLRSGDYLVVYQRRGVQYDASLQRLRWDGGEPVAAELLVTGPGAAAFRIR